MGESGWRVHLLDGPFDGSKTTLLAPGPVVDPPPYVEAYVCPCCLAVAVLDPTDPRCAELVKWGAGAGVIYAFIESEQIPTRRANYRWVQISARAAEEEVAVAG